MLIIELPNTLFQSIFMRISNDPPLIELLKIVEIPMTPRDSYTPSNKECFLPKHRLFLEYKIRPGSYQKKMGTDIVKNIKMHALSYKTHYLEDLRRSADR